MKTLRYTLRSGRQFEMNGVTEEFAQSELDGWRRNWTDYEPPVLVSGAVTWTATVPERYRFALKSDDVVAVEIID